MSAKTADFLVIGAGVIGLNIALLLKARFSDSCVCILEKEGEPGLHGSGRNSGVLHAGFYYSADSMKANSSHAMEPIPQLGLYLWHSYR